MDFAKILAQLREELRNVDAAIETLERLQQGTRRRSRPGAESELSSHDGFPPSLKNPGGGRAAASRKARRNDPSPAQ